ncbi:hypothetical protein CXS67_23840, partial [Salmonella enterica]|nr:hypothetical protein [Salmonella enterica]
MLEYILTETEQQHLEEMVAGIFFVMNKKSTLDDEKEVFGEGGCFYSKNVNEPVLNAIFRKDSLFQLNLHRLSANNVWNKATISFTKYPGYIRYEYIDFVRKNKLAFDQMIEGDRKFQYKDGEGFYHDHYFDYNYHTTIGVPIKITFRANNCSDNDLYSVCISK